MIDLALGLDYPCMNSNFERFHEILNQASFEISAVYLIWNLKICQDASNQEQDDPFIAFSQYTFELYQGLKLQKCQNVVQNRFYQS